MVAVLAFGLAASQPERVARLTGFLNPIANYGTQGWQASHGFFALATGGIWGSGIGASNQKWGNLPGAHTDFIFAIIGEEFGLFGTLVVLGLFVTLAYVGIRIASRTPDKFVRYASAGIVVWLLSQALINIGMVLGLLPVIGIPLPLISYGGSALRADPRVARSAALVRPDRARRAGRVARHGAATAVGRWQPTARPGGLADGIGARPARRWRVGRPHLAAHRHGATPWSGWRPARRSSAWARLVGWRPG